MAKFDVVYFTGCPLVERARKALREAGISTFTEVNQDRLPEGHAYRMLSSPSILVDGRLIAGTRNNAGSCSILNWDGLPELLRTALK